MVTVGFRVMISSVAAPTVAPDPYPMVKVDGVAVDRAVAYYNSLKVGLYRKASCQESIFLTTTLIERVFLTLAARFLIYEIETWIVELDSM